MRIAFLFIAEAYQAYHLAGVALELRRKPGVEVDIYYNDPAMPRHVERICAAFGEPPLNAIRLKRDWKARLIQMPRLLGLAKKQVLAANLEELMGYDMVVSSERVGGNLAQLAGDRLRWAKLVYIPHGPVGRQVASEAKAGLFDLLLLPGQGDLERYGALGCLHEGGYRVTGYSKLETVEMLGRSMPPLFSEQRPIVLYNSHKIRNLSSWRPWIEPLLAQFARQDMFNLIVAPHIKMFHRRSESVKDRWRARSTPSILIDPGSDRCLDNSYTQIADIYLGDVSSQVTEFLRYPRPCVFLNPNKVEWRGDPHFRFWTLGEVVEDIDDLMPALRRAQELHPHYMKAQKAFIGSSLLQPPGGAIRYTADSLLEYLEKGRVDP
ncbi:glycerophosphotransferase [Sphingobium jiangsuense]|uniref:Glycerophosphotransferase n=1 Tax=Sphingobium jiangsuense TaxID=870476 RepID=A0A7W6BKJ6_9SPHN|nr:hypothetical protein [Sphingobium jiangsuense]MBB3927619.1 hypothetical protein [Sphingobium jiangsuense]GLS98726.1 glycerophosphotransferase [Sphingobium jiangsuense]